MFLVLLDVPAFSHEVASSTGGHELGAHGPGLLLFLSTGFKPNKQQHLLPIMATAIRAESGEGCFLEGSGSRSFREGGEVRRPPATTRSCCSCWLLSWHALPKTSWTST